jgi:hypothetical protein
MLSCWMIFQEFWTTFCESLAGTWTCFPCNLCGYGLSCRSGSTCLSNHLLCSREPSGQISRSCSRYLCPRCDSKLDWPLDWRALQKCARLLPACGEAGQSQHLHDEIHSIQCRLCPRRYQNYEPSQCPQTFFPNCETSRFSGYYALSLCTCATLSLLLVRILGVKNGSRDDGRGEGAQGEV